MNDAMEYFDIKVICYKKHDDTISNYHTILITAFKAFNMKIAI